MITQVTNLTEAIEKTSAVFEWFGTVEPAGQDSALEMAHDILEYSANKYGDRNTVDAAMAMIGLALSTLLTLKELTYHENN